MDKHEAIFIFLLIAILILAVTAGKSKKSNRPSTIGDQLRDTHNRVPP